MAWKMPLLMVRRGVENEPLSAMGTSAPCITTVNKIIIILINASVLALANYHKLAISSS